MGQDARAQIGVYNANGNGSDEPIVVITRNGYGHPTGHQGVVSDLVDAVQEIVTDNSGRWDGPTLAARLIACLVSRGIPNQYSIEEGLDVDTRFYYAVRPAGVTVYDARPMENLVDISMEAEMFHTAWVEPERLREAEKTVRELEDKLSAAKLELEGVKRKQPKK